MLVLNIAFCPFVYLALDDPAIVEKELERNCSKGYFYITVRSLIVCLHPAKVW